MGELKIRHRVPFVGQRDGGSLPFNQWIPEDQASVITVEWDGLRVAVSVDRTCVDSLQGHVTDELLIGWQNIRVVALIVEVMTDIPDDLGLFIVEKERWQEGEDIINAPNAATREMAERYAELGRKVMLAVLDVTNRIASWAYAEHGVYWLSTRKKTTGRTQSNNNEFNAQATFSGSRLVRWRPPVEQEPIVFLLDLELSIRPDQWNSIADFVCSTRRPDAIGEILSNARVHLANGHVRGAVIEAVAALEAAVSRFMESPLLEALRSDRAYTNEKFTSVFKHLGFSATVEHLLPLLLPTALLTPDLLSKACAAVQCRHNIVHNQQRNLESQTAAAHVASAAQLIAVLREATRNL